MYKLINAEEIILIAFEDKNFSEEYIQDETILECQEINLPGTIGRELYEELQTQSSQGGSIYTAENKFLVDNYLKKAIAYFVKAKLYPLMVAKLMNAGVITHRDQEDTQASSAINIASAINATVASAEFWLRAAIHFMEQENQINNYPLYHDFIRKNTNNEINTFSSWINL